MEFNILNRTILLVLSGSHAYAMARPESDIDVRGVAIPPAEYFHGFLKRFEQCEERIARDAKFDPHCCAEFGPAIEKAAGRKLAEDEIVDSVIFDIRKFMNLCALGNPNQHDILWADQAATIWMSPLAEDIISKRDLFLSTKVRWTYSGYAMAQLKRIKLHRRYLLNPPKKKPERSDFGLPERSLMPRDQLLAAESLIKRKIEEWIGSKEELPKDVLIELRQRTAHAIRDIWAALISERNQTDGEFLDAVAPPVTEEGDIDEGQICHAAGLALGYDTNFLIHLDRERAYRSKMREFKQYEEWKKNRNPARAAMESKFGFDGKHASHLVRLMRQGMEIIQTGKVNIRRPDAEELLSIRNGSWTYDQLIEWAERQDAELGKIYDSGTSPLPHKPRMAEIDALCQEIVEKALSEGVHAR